MSNADRTLNDLGVLLAGLYLYLPALDETIPILQGEPHIVEVYPRAGRGGWTVTVCGTYASYDARLCRGVLIGPLAGRETIPAHTYGYGVFDLAGSRERNRPTITVESSGEPDLR